MGSPQGLLCPEGGGGGGGRGFHWFWAYVLYFIFLKVHKFCNRLIYYRTIFGNFIFSSFGEPPGELFCPQDLCLAVLWLSLLLFYCLDIRNIWAKFYAFIAICMTLVTMILTSCDKKAATAVFLVKLLKENKKKKKKEGRNGYFNILGGNYAWMTEIQTKQICGWIILFCIHLEKYWGILHLWN